MDNEIWKIIEKENERQNEGIELIASENYASKEVRDACGSILKIGRASCRERV